MDDADRGVGTITSISASVCGEKLSSQNCLVELPANRKFTCFSKVNIVFNGGYQCLTTAFHYMPQPRFI